jgi:hypothetical protein
MRGKPFRDLTGPQKFAVVVSFALSTCLLWLMVFLPYFYRG